MSQAPRGLLGRIAAGAVSFTVLTYVLAIGISFGLVTTRQFAGQLESIRVHFFTGAFFIYPTITPIPVARLRLTATCITSYFPCFIADSPPRSAALTASRRLR